MELTKIPKEVNMEDTNNNIIVVVISYLTQKLMVDSKVNMDKEATIHKAVIQTIHPNKESKDHNQDIQVNKEVNYLHRTTLEWVSNKYRTQATKDIKTHNNHKCQCTTGKARVGIFNKETNLRDESLYVKRTWFENLLISLLRGQIFY